MKFEELPESIQKTYKKTDVVRVRGVETEHGTTFTVTTRGRIYTWKWDNSSPDRSRHCWKSTMRMRLPLNS